MTDDMMDGEEVIQHVMMVTGMSRRQAKRDIIKKINAGEIPAFSLDMEPIVHIDRIKDDDQ